MFLIHIIFYWHVLHLPFIFHITKINSKKGQPIFQPIFRPASLSYVIVFMFVVYKFLADFHSFIYKKILIEKQNFS